MIRAVSSYFASIYKEIKVNLHYTIFLFYLVIYLRVKYSEKLFLDDKKVIKQEPEHGCKNCSTITDNGVGKTVLLHYHINNHFCKFWNIDVDFNWLVIYYFGEVVNNDKN